MPDNVVIVGIDSNSASSTSSGVAPDCNTPAPACSTGRSAASSSLHAARTVSGSHSVRMAWLGAWRDAERPTGCSITSMGSSSATGPRRPLRSPV
ncbi:Uncharacterised protein [Bordetella pertussis]|nr:Uncharacterised protein [Bordetella pertussis]